MRCTFDETHNEWCYLTSIPKRDEDVLDEICKSNKPSTMVGAETLQKRQEILLDDTPILTHTENGGDYHG